MVIDVAAGVLINPQGKVLLAQRPQGKVYAGWWEVPGGKFEPGEDAHQALARELQEELGLQIQSSSAWCVCEYEYPHGHVRLHFRRLWHWQGEPLALESQALVWIDPASTVESRVSPMLPATEPLIAWLALPPSMGGSDPRIEQIDWLDADDLEQGRSMIEARSATSLKPVYLRLGEQYLDVIRLAAQDWLGSSLDSASPDTR